MQHHRTLAQEIFSWIPVVTPPILTVLGIMFFNHIDNNSHPYIPPDASAVQHAIEVDELPHADEDISI